MGRNYGMTSQANTTEGGASSYAQLKQRFPQELRLLINRLLSRELHERALIYPAFAESNGSYTIITLIPPESAEGEEKGQSTVCVSSLSRSGMKSYDGFFGTEQKCNKWVESTIQHGGFTRLGDGTVQENLRRLLGDRCSAWDILGR